MPETLVSDPPAIDVSGVHKEFAGRDGGAPMVAIDDLTFTQRSGEFVCLVGPSGCGKTTLLRCLSALSEPTAGAVRYGGAAVDGVPPDLAVVFQEYNRSLFPWLSVERNVALALSDLAKGERGERVADALERVGLGDFAGHYPWQLSGGMQQRVAIARAIAARPRILLMDEPFASVDAQTRTALEAMVLDLWLEYDWTVTLVTHDIDEAVFLADRVLVLSKRPSRIVEEVVIDLPRPRDQLETRALPEFQSYRRQITELILDRP